MDLTFAISAFVTLFVIIDPIGLTPMFVALTHGMSAQARRRISIRAGLVSIGILMIFGIAGDEVLAFIGISMSAFRIAGGILLFVTAFDMLFERRTERRESRAGEVEPADDPSIFPLAMPLIAGPGAMASMILLIGDAGQDMGKILTVHGAMLLVIALALVMFQTAGLFERLLGMTGIRVITRLLGMLLAALSVQFVLDGLRDFGFVAN